jgi:hypothetical protein
MGESHAVRPPLGGTVGGAEGVWVLTLSPVGGDHVHVLCLAWCVSSRRDGVKAEMRMRVRRLLEEMAQRLWWGWLLGAGFEQRCWLRLSDHCLMSPR